MAYTGYSVFKVTNINRTNGTITGTFVYGPLNIAAIGTTTPIKATFVKATDLEVAQTGTGPTMEIEFNYRNKF